MRKTTTTPSFPVRPAAAAALLGLSLLAACGGEESETDRAADAAGTTAGSVTVADAWARAAEEGMTAVFGVLENEAATDAHLVAAESDLAAIELHEVVEADGAAMMQEVSEGFTVPAGGSHELAPGGDHLMLMGLSAPLVAGDEVAVTLVFEDGSELEFTAVAKDFEGGDEEYRPGGTGDV